MTMSLYQSHIRKTIQKDIYQKPSFTLHLFGKDYFWTIKTKKIGPITLKRYQILWIELPKDHKEISKAIQKIKSEFWHHWTDIFFQRGVTTSIQTFDVKDIDNELASSLRDTRLSLRTHFKEDYHLIHSFRENLPESNIIIDITKTNEELLREMNKSSRVRVRKWIENGITFRTLQEHEYQKFYNKRQTTADKKWFNTISENQYTKLIKELIQTKTGNVVITEKDGEILAGSIVIYDDKNMVWLYGFADRTHNTIGGQQYLKFKTFERAREQGFTTFDLMGGAPTGFPEHELTSVSAFKESIGGKKIEYTGNFDIILNPRLYKIFKRLFTLKK